MNNFLDLGLTNYAILDEIINMVMENRMIDGLWKFNFDGSCSKNDSSIGVVNEVHDSRVYPHALKL